MPLLKFPLKSAAVSSDGISSDTHGTSLARQFNNATDAKFVSIFDTVKYAIRGFN